MSYTSMWSKLRGKTYTLNFDGSHNNQENKAGAGCIIRDNQGEMIIAAAYNLTQAYPDCNVAIAEAVALRKGLNLAKNNGYNVNVIKGDSKEVIDHVLNLSRRPARSPLSGIIQQIQGMINLSSQKIQVVARDDNKVADNLAYWGSTRLIVDHFIYYASADLPPQIAELIKKEKSYNGIQAADDGAGSSSSMAGTIGMAGAAVAGVAMLAMGLSKLLGETTYDDNDQVNLNKAKAPCYYNASKTPQLLKFRDTSYERSHNYEFNPPKNNEYYTLNVDGSDIHQHQKGGAGCIIRNKRGELVIAAAYNLDNLYLNQCHVAIAEAIALRNGLNLAKSNSIKLDLIKGDNKEVIDRVLGKEKNPPAVPYLNVIICQIREALNEQSIDPESQIKKIGREANKVANELAKLGSNLEHGMVKTFEEGEDLPLKIAQLIEKDNDLMGVYSY